MNLLQPSTLRVAQKIAVCAALVAAIGGAIALVGGEDARADIAALDWVPLDKHERFVDTLRRRGMSRPRSYDWNGNTVYFSTKTTDRRPMQVLRSMQDAFVMEGVNKRTYLRAPFGSQMTGGPRAFRTGSDAYAELLDGGMIPMAVGRDRVVMTGVELRDGAAMPEVLDAMLADRSRVAQMVRRLRYVEAYRTRDSRKTVVNAVWSDGDLDMRRFTPNSSAAGAAGPSPPLDLPICPGCERKRRFAGEGGEAGWIDTIVHGSLSARSAYDFYLRELTGRGWQTSQSQRLLGAVAQRGLGPFLEPILEPNGAEYFLAFARGDEHLQVLVSRAPDARHTTIHLMRSP